MDTNSPDPVADIESYQAQTDALVDSIEETTALLSEMSDNMARLSRSFEDFGSTGTRGADSHPTARDANPSVAAD